jgi:hypothetical protein
VIDISVDPFQHFPLASVFVAWAVLVGDTDKKGSPLRCRATCFVLAKTFDIILGRVRLQVAARPANQTVQPAERPECDKTDKREPRIGHGLEEKVWVSL